MKFIISITIILLSVSVNAGPVLSIVDSTSIDFGTFPANQAQNKTITLKNAGDEVLKIVRIRQTCGCSAAKPDSNSIAPNDSTVLKVGILANSIKGSFSKKVFIQTNDPATRFTVLTLKGTATPRVEISPRERLYPERLILNKPNVYSFSLKRVQKDVVFGEPTIECNYPASVTSIQKSPDELTVMVTITPDKLKGKLTTTVVIPTDKTKTDVCKLYISAEVGPAMYAIPNRIVLPSNSKEMTAIVKLKFVGISPSDIQPENLSWEKIPGVAFQRQESDDSMPSIKVTFTSEAIQQLRGKKESLILTYPNTPTCKIQLR